MSFFSGNEYHTPETGKRVLADKLMLGTSIYFLSGFLDIVFSTRRIALNGKYDNDAWIDSSMRIVDLIERCGGRFHISGLDNIRKEKGAVVFISNHMSILETMVFPGILAGEKWITFAVKDSLIRHFVFGPIMRSRNPIALSRSNPREDLLILLSRGQELLAQGCSVVIFPQSTRSVNFSASEFNSIGTKLAARAGVPIVPIAIKTDFWANGRIVKDLGSIHRDRPIYMDFGEPIHLSGSGKEEHAYIVDFIRTRISNWQCVKNNH